MIENPQPSTLNPQPTPDSQPSTLNPQLTPDSQPSTLNHQLSHPHLTVCICTYQRPAMLARLLRDIASQQTDGAFTLSVVVTDNDAAKSAQAAAEDCARECALNLLYTVEPRKNIAHARNTAVSRAKGEFIAFIDDDEFPDTNWLLNLYRTCEKHQVAGVLGPVKPHFADHTPGWVIKGGFYDRPTHATGFEMAWTECRTGNVLLRRSILNSSPAINHQPSTTNPPFDPQFGTGGEDQDFFRRMTERGHCFIWCNEAVAWETVPATRCSRRFMLNRALLRGRNSFRHGKHRLRNLAKSAIAIPTYLLALPVLLLAGHHLFMKYLVKLTDHTGRVLALLGLNPVNERRM